MLSLVMAITVMVSVVAGCGEKTDTGDQATSTSSTIASATATPEEKPLEKTELSMYVIGTPQNGTDEVVAEVNKLLEPAINATLEFNIIDWGAYNDKMKLLNSAGDDLDLAFTCSWANDVVDGMSKGYFEPLNELLEKYGQNILSALPKQTLEAVTYKGKIMAVPSYIGFGTPTGVNFKKELVDKYKFDYSTVKTLKDLEAYLATIKANEPGITPFLSMDISPLAGAGLLSGKFGGFTQLNGTLAYNHETGKIVNFYEEPSVREYFALMQDWQSKGYIAKDQATKTDIKLENGSGKYAVMYGNYQIGDGGVKNSAEYGYEIIDHTMYSKAFVGTANVQSSNMAIKAGSPNAERAMMFLNMLWDKPGTVGFKIYNLLGFGVEGKHYKVLEQGEIPLIEILPEGGFSAALAWEFGNGFNRYSTPSEGKAFHDMELKNNENADYSPILGFSFFAENVKNESAAINSLYAKYATILNSGVGGMEQLDKFNNEMKASGLDKILAEADKQISEWKAANGK